MIKMTLAASTLTAQKRTPSYFKSRRIARSPIRGASTWEPIKEKKR
jgi:hypothetical protein